MYKIKFKLFELKKKFIRFFRQFYVLYISNKLSNQILINSKKEDKFCLAIDLINCPATFGDNINFISLARYLKSLSKKVEVYIINSELRRNWQNMSKEKMRSFLNEFLNFANSTTSKDIEFHIVKWKKFMKIIDEFLFDFSSQFSL